ncbi:MAG: hypothetical protein J7L96_02475 [Bacteroidales bacterium]|nr:hypothetical protein [Bacteroidales bacterium]
MSHFRSVILVLLGISFSGLLNAQELISRTEILQPVNELLDQYQERLGKIKKYAGSDYTRDFVAIFSNPNVRVIDNLQNDSLLESISIQKYCSRLKTKYPEGVTAKILDKRIKLGKIEHDLGSWYLVKVKVHMNLTAYYGGKVFDYSHLQVFTIAFSWEGNSADAFRIYEISLPVYDAQELWLNTSLSGSFISAPWVRQDSRFTNPIRASNSLELLYLYWLNSQIGLSTGIRANYYNSRVELDNLNSFSTKDPNLSDVSFSTGLYHLEIPVLCFYKTNLPGRFNAIAGGGLFWSQRFWATSTSSALNMSYNIVQNNIISDQNWMNHFSKSFLGAEIHAGLRIEIGQRISLSADARYIQGLTAMDKNNDLRFATERYTGQYNPLWMDPDSHNYMQALSLRLGVVLLLNNQDE